MNDLMTFHDPFAREDAATGGARRIRSLDGRRLPTGSTLSDSAACELRRALAFNELAITKVANSVAIDV